MLTRPSLSILLLTTLLAASPSLMGQSEPAPDSGKPSTTVEGDKPEWWKNTGHPKGQWWTSYAGYDGEAADKIWETVPIPPSPLLSPEEALSSFEVDDRFRVELVAAEPLVVRPVFMRLDELGRLWVVEMPGYMRDIDGTGQEDPSGRVVVLEDEDGDGRMDKSTTFLEGLVMPRTLALVPGGALVVEPPRIWLARDQDGDLVADEKVLLAEDYGVEGNPEHSANGLLPALDNWMYSAKSAVRYQLRGAELVAEHTLFRGQWGISQDDTGRLFYNYNASPLHADLAPAEYFLAPPEPNLALARNVTGSVLLNKSLAQDKSLFPARVTPLVTLGASDLRPDGTLKQFTSASAPLIYRGDLFPEALRGDAFICDPVGNLVSHMKIEDDGLGLTAHRSQEGREFLASTDERFRPVFLESGPDGAIYLADMYTGIVEHKRYVTPYLRNQVLGRGMGNFTATGRIYRIVPKDLPAGSRPSWHPPMSASQWVSRLNSGNGWERDTAQRILVQGEHQDAVPALRDLVVDGEASALGRIHALWTLEGLGQLDAVSVAAGLNSAEERLRAVAIRLSERLPAAAAAPLHATIKTLAQDEAASVRLQVMLTAGTWPESEGWPVMQTLLARNDVPPEMGLAAAAGLRGQELRFLTVALDRETVRPSDPAWEQLLQQIGYNVLLRGDVAEVGELLSRLEALPPSEPLSRALWRGAAAYERNGAPLRLALKPEVFDAMQSWPDGSPQTEATKVFSGISWPHDDRFAAEEVEPLTAVQLARFEQGRQTYALICAACHQADGMGMAGVAPPLAGSKWVIGNPRVPVEIVQHGLSGPVEVKGRTWDMVMPALGSVPGMFDDEKLAALATYLRRAWGNQASPLAPEDVRRIRALSADRSNPWSAAELQALPDYQPVEEAR